MPRELARAPERRVRDDKRALARVQLRRYLVCYLPAKKQRLCLATNMPLAAATGPAHEGWAKAKGSK